MDWNEEMLGKWQKIELEDGKRVHIREAKRKEVTGTEKEEPRVSKKEIREGIKITYRQHKPQLGRVTVILVDENEEFLGLCEFVIKEEHALLGAREQNDIKGNAYYRPMELPEELENAREDIEDNIDAFYVHPEKKYQGIGSQLLLISFNYLLRKGINRVEVYPGQSEDPENDPREFYRKTGAIEDENHTFWYEDLKENIRIIAERIKQKEAEKSNQGEGR